MACGRERPVFTAHSPPAREYLLSASASLGEHRPSDGWPMSVPSKSVLRSLIRFIECETVQAEWVARQGLNRASAAIPVVPDGCA